MSRAPRAQQSKRSRRQRRPAKLYSYVLKRFSRPETVGPFTRLETARDIANAPRKYAEMIARTLSKQHARDLVTLERERVVVSRLINGRHVDEHAVAFQHVRPDAITATRVG
jgi:hypothetical protein